MLLKGELTNLVSPKRKGKNIFDYKNKNKIKW